MDWETANEKLRKYCLLSFRNATLVERYVRDFRLDELIQPLDCDQAMSVSSDLLRTVNPLEVKPFPPRLDDLARLHYLILTRRVLNVLEFGSGYSTVIMASAMTLLRRKFGVWASSHLRVQEPFMVYSVEEDQRFAIITRSRLGTLLDDYAKVFRSSVSIIELNHRFATVYDWIPNVSPDFIYLDGPSQFASTETVHGFSLDVSCRMPMAADIIRIEFFLEPGTMILVDGRTANARFLRSNFRQNWSYEHDQIGDVHFFELDEQPLGEFNKRKLELRST